jgi:8-oxo-dGTP pyrophosphatase MutT (NUDIX family)
VLRGVTLGVRGLVTNEDGRVLLVRHSYVPGWYLPGGGVEPGETALESLARELDEEAGIAIAGETRLVGLYFNVEARRRDHVALFHVPEFRRLRPFAPNAEIREAEFFHADDLPHDTTDATRRRIREVIDGAESGPHW